MYPVKDTVPIIFFRPFSCKTNREISSKTNLKIHRAVSTEACVLMVTTRDSERMDWNLELESMRSRNIHF